MTPTAPTGAVTFLFTDIEGSTRLWERHRPVMAEVLSRHDDLLRAAVAERDGLVFKHTGDGILAVFEAPSAALDAAVAGQRALLAEPWVETGGLRVRMAVHTGEAQTREGDYVGPTVNRAARLLDAAHGGQILISAATAALVHDRLEAGFGLRDLGRQRLRDLARAEHLYQVTHPDLPGEFAAPRSLDAFPHNLPVQLTRFVGRHEQLAEVKALLADTRLLTLTGIGGVGKSRLALQAAADLLDGYPDGVWLVELAPLTQPELLPKTLSQVLGVREDPTVFVVETLIEHLEDKRLLLIFDNCEHLIDPIARLTERLLRSCRDLTILATSREGLGIPGERLWLVPSLTAPGPSHDLDALDEYESVRLFLDRARAVQPGFTLDASTGPAVAEICRRLDGIALAIELAAARLRVLSVTKLAARLDDRFRLLTGGSRTALPRQRTLQAAMDWSYDLLDPPARTLLERLSVFQGGFTLEAAERVCTDPDDDTVVLDVVERLVDASLLLVADDGGRFHMLETVRQYAQDRLAASGDAERRRQAHLAWVVDLASRAEPGLRGPEQAAWTRRLDRERNNVRLALAWALETGRSDDAVAVVAGMGRFWYLYGPYAEALDWMLEALRRPAAAAPVRGEAERWAASVALNKGELDRAAALAERARETHLAAGNPAGAGMARVTQAFVAHGRGDFESAALLLRDAAEEMEAHGDPEGAMVALANLEGVVRRMGDPERSARIAEHLLDRAVEHDNCRLEGLARAGLASAALFRGDLAAADDEYRRFTTVLTEAGEEVWLIQVAAGLAFWSYSMGHVEFGDRVGAESLRLAEQSRFDLGRAVARVLAGYGALHHGDLDEAAAELSRARTMLEEIGAGEELAGVLSMEGEIALARGEADRAEARATEAIAALQAIGAVGVESEAATVLAEALLAQEEIRRARLSAHRAVQTAEWSKSVYQLVTAVEVVALLHERTGAAEPALLLFAAAAAARAAVRSVPVVSRRTRIEAALDRIRTGLDAQEFDDVWTRGTNIARHELAGYALASLEAGDVPAEI